MNYSLRLKKLRAALAAANCEAFVVASGINVRYLCGFTGSSGALVVTPQNAWFVTDFRYQSQAALQVSPEFETVIADDGLWPESARLLKNVAQIGFEAEHISVATLHEIEELIQPSRAVALNKIVEELRLIKDADEIAIIERAVEIIDETFEAICRVLEVGQSELDVSRKLLDLMQERGASGVSFETIVASGKRGALPHGVASAKKLERGDMITIDMGAVFDGYCSDFTRTVCLGTPTSQQQHIYETVWDAQTAACAALYPGLSCVEADAVARKIIDDAGFGAAFGHGLGHGVGLEIHEQPRLSKLGKGELRAGMIVTCEPGIYLDEWGGVRIEDMLLITESGNRVLTKGHKPREIIAV